MWRRILAVACLATCLIACGDDDTEGPADTTTTTDATTSPDVTVTADTDVAVDTDTETPGPTPVSCLDRPETLSRPSDTLPCELIPPSFE